MFEISLRKCSAEMNRVDKSSAMSDLLSIYGTLKEGCSLYEPSIRVKLSPEKMFGYNYAYIDAFKRYYFIKEVSTDVNGYVLLDMVTDVLMTFKDQFKSCSAFVLRNQNKFNDFLGDKRRPTTNKLKLDIQKGTQIWNSGAIKGGDYYRAIICLSSNVLANNESRLAGGIVATHNGMTGNPSYGYDVVPAIKDRDANHNGMIILAVTTNGLHLIMRDIAASDKIQSLISGNLISIYSIPPFGEAADGGNSFLRNNYFTDLEEGWRIGFLDDNGKITSFDVPPPLEEETLTPFRWLNPIVGAVYSQFVFYSTFDVKLSSYRDYPPYKSYTLLLPFVGTLELEDGWLISKENDTCTIKVQVAIDWTCGEICYYVSINDVFCTSKSARFSSICPVSSNNLAELSAERQAATTKSIGTGISIATKGITGLISGIGLATMPHMAPIGIAQAANSLAGAIGAGAELGFGLEAMKDRQVPRTQSSMPDSQYLSTFTNTNICLLTQYVAFEDDFETFRSLNGAPLQEFSTIGDMKGYTEFGVIHLDGVTALKPELEELERKLHEGVIL